ncbi:aldehyde dehydrogenase [Mycolicibacterium anyangense]|uniref:Aldehyde dehydrogenase n=1 Tax=Mycolicibacterium anyangense TaxID=1431246 RepID=A0A6N4WAQ1_9MYCO|nr:aldehyde dehydrogenase family protein [Mycolicibacterium anyangense]BBZ77124.1 aldehyde dehydrogenase [Mycolicibacterium anyangense]
MRNYETFFIDGAQQQARGDRMIDVYSPATETVVGRVPDASAADVDAAVGAARAALDRGDWASTTPEQRGSIVKSLANSLASRAAELTAVVSEETGAPTTWAASAQIGSAIAVLKVNARLAATYPWTEVRPSVMGGSVQVRRMPVGVVAAIVPWNAPLFTAALKLAPALLAGCSVVLKSSLEAPLTLQLLGEAATEAGVPRGVLNVLPADSEASAHLVAHPLVDKVSFTGSTAVGRKIAEVCGRDLRRCTLELGGKSAAIVTGDVELDDKLVKNLVDGAIAGSGQVCMATSRILVPRRRLREFADRIGNAFSRLVVGDPRDPATEIGPVISAQSLSRIEGLIDETRGKAELVVGGHRPAGLSTGHYLAPTLFADVDPALLIARQEIFGPVALLIPYDTDTDAVRIANDTEYGLAGTVWSADQSRAEQLASQIIAGSVAVNSANPLDISAPFGGFRSSGYGREGGHEGITEFLSYQSIITPGV